MTDSIGISTQLTSLSFIDTAKLLLLEPTETLPSSTCIYLECLALQLEIGHR